MSANVSVLRLGIIGVLVVTLVLQSLTMTASAASHLGIKYFANTAPTKAELNKNGQGDVLFYDGIPSEVRNKADFLNYVESMYDGSNPVTVTANQDSRYAVAAAYIIRTMIGSPVGSSKTVSAAEIKDWRSRVNSSDISLSVGSYNGKVNTSMTNTSRKLVGIQYYDVVQLAFDESVDSLLFRDSSRGGDVVYALQLKCANPLGNLSLPPLNYDLVPTISVTPDASEGGGAPASVAPVITNRGSTPSDTAQWQVTNFIVRPGQAVPTAATNNRIPVAYFNNTPRTIQSGLGNFDRGANTITPTTQIINDYPVGTRVCYALSVQPVTQSNSNWRHSTPDCIVIGKKPKLQVRGGDIKVGGNFADQTASATANIVTSQSVKRTGTPLANRTFGSWGEYGVSARGSIRGIGSGSAFAGQGLANVGTSLCSYTFLTITNGGTSNCKANPVQGLYTTGMTLPDIAARYPGTTAPVISGAQTISSLNGTYRTVGAALTLTGGSLPAGRTVIINTYNPATGTYGDVTVAGNLTYATGPFASNDAIPQLVIIAGNIGIQSAVSQLDGWLVSRGTLNTCINVARTDINSTNCQTPLTVNGPVMAAQVNFWRTGGSGTGAASGNPAEVFNLRPDAYLWGIAQSTRSGRLETVYQRELPPRF